MRRGDLGEGRRRGEDRRRRHRRRSRSNVVQYIPPKGRSKPLQTSGAPS